jgi:membrane-associated protease RseP (regulator of RpoE activity)
MVRCTLLLACWLALFISLGLGQSPQPMSPAGAKLISPAGIAVAPVPDLLHDHLKLPSLKRGHGLVIDRLDPDSPAAQAGLKRHDILVTYDGKWIRDAEHLAQLLQDAAPERKVPVVLVRGGRELTVQASLAQALADTALTATVPKGWIKPDGPPAVSIEAESLASGKMQVTFLFYCTGKGKLERLTCTGSLDEIEQQVRALGTQNQMPRDVQELVGVALRRLRNLNIRP